MRSSTFSLPPARLFIAAGGLLLALVAALIVLFTPEPLNLAILPGLVFATILVLVPWTGPLALVLSIPVQEYHALPFGGLSLTATKIALAVAVAAFAIQVVSRRESLRGSILLVPYLAFIGTMLISLHGAVDINAGLAEIYRWAVTLVARHRAVRHTPSHGNPRDRGRYGFRCLL